MSSDYLKVEFLDGVADEGENFKFRLKPFALDDEIFYGTIKRAQKLTQGEDVKTVYCVSFDVENLKQDFLAGDTIGVLPRNSKILVEKIFSRLDLASVAEKPCELKISDIGKKIPKHLPVKTTLKELFLHHVDILTPPKKFFLKSLARFAQDPEERAKLEEMSTSQSKQYTDLVSGPDSTLLKLLETFPSCKPPVGALLQYLPALQPRPYSISSSPLSGALDITFFVLERDGRKGLCTGWLEELILQKSQEKVPFYFRKPTDFRLSREVPEPVILVAAGTGIAPFRGFLQDLKLRNGNREVWLVYGCRYREKDFLFKEEVEECVGLGIVKKLDLAFSRDSDKKTYVQDCIETEHVEFVEWVLIKEAQMFVCGDAKTVVRGLRHGLIDRFGENFLRALEMTGRFVVDSWS